MIQTVPQPNAQVGATAKSTRRAFQGADAIRKFTLIFNRPSTAARVEPAERARSLQILCSQIAHMVEDYIQVTVTPLPNGNERFEIEFLTNPEHQIAVHNAKEAMARLTPDSFHRQLADGTGLQARFIKVVEVVDCKF